MLRLGSINVLTCKPSKSTKNLGILSWFLTKTDSYFETNQDVNKPNLYPIKTPDLYFTLLPVLLKYKLSTKK
jgi:hypothetical protein